MWAYQDSCLREIALLFVSFAPLSREVSRCIHRAFIKVLSQLGVKARVAT